MLKILALTRPSRSVDLSNLDIKTPMFISDRVVFKPTQLSKQSSVSHLLADFFSSFKQDISLCSVELKAYESQTLQFRGMDQCRIHLLSTLQFQLELHLHGMYHNGYHFG